MAHEHTQEGNLRPRSGENDRSWVLSVCCPVSQSLAQSGHGRVYGQDFEWFLALLSRGIGALRGRRALSPSHQALPTPHPQEQLSRVPPTAQEGHPLGRAAGWALLQGSCLGQEELPILPGCAGGGCPPRPSPEALTLTRWANPGRAF